MHEVEDRFPDMLDDSGNRNYPYAMGFLNGIMNNYDRAVVRALEHLSEAITVVDTDRALDDDEKIDVLETGITRARYALESLLKNRDRLGTEVAGQWWIKHTPLETLRHPRKPEEMEL